MSLRDEPGAMTRYKREWAAKRRKEWFVGKLCSRCGSIESLEIHHVDPSEKVSNHIWSWSKKKKGRRTQEVHNPLRGLS
jgi:hypothetical protein